MEDDWESPTLGAWGLGWEVWLDGMEITQFTYFQQAGSIDLHPITAEITYGLERITMFLGLSRSVYDIDWVPGGLDYGLVRHQDEVEFSRLALLVVDEQHRFGVHQRLALRENILFARCQAFCLGSPDFCRARHSCPCSLSLA